MAKQVWGAMFFISLLGIPNVSRVFEDSEQPLLSSNLTPFPQTHLVTASPSQAVCSIKHL